MADVLIVDDDADNADTVADILRDEGHVVRVAHDGQEGLERARERTPDVAVLDVEMPILDGPGMAYQMFVRDMGLELVPVVLISGMPRLRQIAAEVGTQYFLGKPFGYTQLVALVARALAERHAPDRATPAVAPR